MPKTLRCAAALLLYTAAALLLFGRGAHWRGAYLGWGTDPISYIWFLNWWPFAIRHGLNPFITTYVWFPHGFNLTWAASIPFFALVMAPVTALWGPVLSFNLLTMAAPVLAAWMAFLLCACITEDWLAALVAGYLYGFSSYELGQILGHLNLDFTCLVPLILLLCIRRVRGDLSSGVFTMALTACLLAQLGIATEILATLCVFGAVTWAVFFRFAGPDVRPALVRLAIEITTAATATILLASPFLYFMVKGMADVPGQINAPQSYVTDLRNFFIPTIVTRFSTPYFLTMSGTFDGNGSEQGAYLSLPLILLAGAFFYRQRRAAYVAPLLLVTLILVLFTLGPHLQIGTSLTHMPLPWLLTQHLPLLGQLLPSRFTMYIALSTAIAAALALATGRGWWRWVNYGLAAAACVLLLPNPAMLSWSPWPESGFFTASNITARLGSMPDVLILPFAGTGPGMAWQLDARMSFRQIGGYVGFVPARERAFPAVTFLFEGDSDARTINALDDFCISHGVEYVLLAPGTPPALAAAVLAQGWPAQDDAGVTVVKVPPAATINYYSLTGDYWPSAAPANWMGRQITIVTHASALHLRILGIWTRPSATMRISVIEGGATAMYPITRTSVIPVVIPPDTAVTITSNETWVPSRYTDRRKLSVLIAVAGP